MGFLDKAKEQASALATKAQDGINQGQAKLDAQQAKKHADGLLRDLGAWTYAQHTGRDDGAAGAEIQRIYGELQAHEAEHGQLGSEAEPAPPAEQAADVAPGVAAPQPPTSPPPSSPPAASPPPPPPAPAAPPAPPAPEPAAGGYTLDDL